MRAVDAGGWLMQLRVAMMAMLVVVLGVASAVPAAVDAAAAGPVGRAAPYEYLGWGSPPSPAAVTAATGIHDFTLAFMLSKKTCDPAWDGTRPLTGGVDQAAIEHIRAAGGDVVVSFGGWSGRKLGNKCKTTGALAAAYQKVIDAYALRAVDIDIEHGEMSGAKVRNRVVAALAAVRRANPAIEIYVTFGSGPSGPDAKGTAMISYAASIGFLPTAWTVMPFDFGGSSTTDMGRDSITAVQGLARVVQTAYRTTAAAAYQHAGISSMNGRTDDGETVTLASFQAMLAFAQQNHLARLTFWSVNRDRACGGSATTADACSGISQAPYAFSRVLAPYEG
jgi:chitinase